MQAAAGNLKDEAISLQDRADSTGAAVRRDGQDPGHEVERIALALADGEHNVAGVGLGLGGDGLSPIQQRAGGQDVVAGGRLLGLDTDNGDQCARNERRQQAVKHAKFSQWI